MPESSPSNAIDPVTLELLQETLISVVREMRATLVSTAYSTIIQEAHDFSCVLIDGRGEIVAQAEDNPSHIFPIPWSVREMFTHFPDDIHPGDVFLHNDPYTGGTHLNDIAMIFPVFSEDRLVVFPVVRAHWGDVGGTTPGSISGKSTEIFHDGVRIPILKIANKGEIDRAVVDLLFANMRVPEERRGDFMSTWGTCKVAEKRIHEITDKFSVDTVAEGIGLLQARAENRMRRKISGLPDGRYVYEHYLDPPRENTDPVKVRAAISIRGDALEIDFAGSSTQVFGPGNSGPANTITGAFIVLKTFLDPGYPVNHGNFRPIDVKIPDGSFLNANYPASCAGSSEVRNAAISAVLGAMGQVIPETMAGDIKGTSNHTYISGTVTSSGKPFLFYEYPAGGTGGTQYSDGNSAIRNFAEGDFGSIQPVESIEHTCDLLVESCSFRADSAGPGQHRGGFGLERNIRLMADTGLLSIASDKNVIPPFGVNGGLSGAPNEFQVIRNGDEIPPSTTPGKVAGFPLTKDDVVSMRSSGGGGWGDPLNREPIDVFQDFSTGLISETFAKDEFGVIFKNNDVDVAATRDHRQKLSENRAFLQTHFFKETSNGENKRVCYVNQTTAADADLHDGLLVEVLSPSGPCLRGWVSIDNQVPDNVLSIGLLARDILRIEKDEEVVQLRPLKTSHSNSGDDAGQTA